MAKGNITFSLTAGKTIKHTLRDRVILSKMVKADGKEHS